FAYTQGKNTQTTFKPSDFGVNTPVFAYDYFAGTGDLLNPSDAIQRQITGDAFYMVLAPVGPSGIAVLGDTDHFVTMGKKRISAFTDRGEARVTVNFAEGETSVPITGYSPVTPLIVALEGSVGQV